MKNRIKAFLIHLFFSLTIVISCIGIISNYYYPSFFYSLCSINEFIEIMLPAYIVLGPALTFIIYKKGKPGLFFDLIVILFLQAGVLLYGSYQLLENRPAYLLFYDDTFYIVPLKALHHEQSFFQPQLAWFDSSSLTAKEKTDLAFENFTKGIPFPFLQRFYRPLGTINVAIMREKAQKLDSVQKTYPQKALDESLLYFPAIGRTRSFTIAFDPINKIPVDVLK